jgi:cation diffusion facilitator CzcD-associated flavoprotein CzcO
MKAELYDAVVIGAGPAGIACVGNLIDSEHNFRILWVDPYF